MIIRNISKGIWKMYEYERHTQKKGSEKNNPCFLSIAILVMLVSLVVVIATIELAKLSGFSFIADHRNVIVSVELTVFVVALVIGIGRSPVAQLPKTRHRACRPTHRRNYTQGSSTSSSPLQLPVPLLSNPALGISLGQVMGVIIPFETQNLISDHRIRNDTCNCKAGTNR